AGTDPPLLLCRTLEGGNHRPGAGSSSRYCEAGHRGGAISSRTAAVHAKVKPTPGCLRFGMKAACKEPRCSNSGVLSDTAFSRKHLTTSGLPNDDRPTIAPAAQMISTLSIPATVQKTTFSDD